MKKIICTTNGAIEAICILNLFFYNNMKKTCFIFKIYTKKSYVLQMERSRQLAY